MTAEAQIEEILIEASAYGIRSQVMDTARQFMTDGHDRLNSYERAFKHLVNE
jgi:hypothetical protein